VNVEAVATTRYEPLSFPLRGLATAHTDAGTVRGHEPVRRRPVVREPAGRIVDRVGRLAALATPVEERVADGSFLNGKNRFSTRSGLPSRARSCASVVTSMRNAPIRPSARTIGSPRAGPPSITQLRTRATHLIGVSIGLRGRPL
jgi:hypothetical protein